MNAIDFCCNFLNSLDKAKLTHPELRILFCVAAGLHDKDSIMSYLPRNSSSSITLVLRRLHKQGLLTHMEHRKNSFKLTSSGKLFIGDILHFLPSKSL